ncbi:YhbY family RNA-binding protein [Acidaminobacter sp. JC074]|uniref:YhbY family RNA-binding protein n=1 Tax=Acidaminobacter sp. JC074 TaxID=2530199 RepID=UPI001F115639|nr:YhbY family RNA-binding protein [Acidaminobacter sp. JC074]MCH4886667.1 YhbY family RNA-binding protein [Acidaminobacter sp. JC074]
MLSNKQRKYLRGLANSLKPMIQMGKDGNKDTFVRQLDMMLENHELVKVNVLETSPMSANEAANYFVDRLNAEYVQDIGRKFVLYRQAQEDPEIVLPK